MQLATESSNRTYGFADRNKMIDGTLPLLFFDLYKITSLRCFIFDLHASLLRHMMRRWAF